MKFQDYSAPKMTLGAVALVAAIIPILLAYFLISGTASSVAYTLPGGPTSTTATASASGTASIAIPKGASSQSGAPGYSPDKSVVVLGVNSTVVWFNDDDAVHSVTALNETDGSPVFNSGALTSGQNFTFTFTTPGTYDYHCLFHTWMSGVIVVVSATSQAAPASTSATSSSTTTTTTSTSTTTTLSTSTTSTSQKQD